MSADYGIAEEVRETLQDEHREQASHMTRLHCIKSTYSLSILDQICGNTVTATVLIKALLKVGHPRDKGSTYQANANYEGSVDSDLTVSKGDSLLVLSVDAHDKRCLVQRVGQDEEGWVPCELLRDNQQDGKKPWTFRMRKPSLKSQRRLKKRKSFEEKGGNASPVPVPLHPATAQPTVGNPFFVDSPTLDFVETLTNTSALEGSTVSLSCRLAPPMAEKLIWRLADGTTLTAEAESSPEEEETASSEKEVSLRERTALTFRSSTGSCTLTLRNCHMTDSGAYTCTAYLADGQDVSTSALLTVQAKPSPPGKPFLIEQRGNSLTLQWSPPVYSGNTPMLAYTLQAVEMENEQKMWNVIAAYTTNCIHLVEDLTPGTSYQFRVSANNEVGISEPSPASNHIYIPVLDEDAINTKCNHCSIEWKTNFKEIYDDICELGRGRFAIVKECVQKDSKMSVAAKFINKKRQSAESVEREFQILQQLQHKQIVQSLETFESPQHYILILECIPGMQLFQYVCEKPIYDEITVCAFMRQLLEVLLFLHTAGIVHLDIKPENLLIHDHNLAPCLKLIDFGDAQRLGTSKSCTHSCIGSPEFSAPEVLGGRVVSTKTDMWSFGVLLYVFLSGVSPFLEESQEETCLNILHNDYSFPDPYFQDISTEACELISQLLVTKQAHRLGAHEILQSKWIKEGGHHPVTQALSTARIAGVLERRQHVQHSIRNIRVT